MTANIEKAMVLAAGMGERLRPLTELRPKPLLEVAGQPLISFSLSLLSGAGIKQVVINTHHLSEQLKTFVRENDLGMQVEIVHEPKLLGPGGGIKNARSFLDGDAPFFVLNSDTVIDADLETMKMIQDQGHPLGTLLVADVPNIAEYGAIGFDSKNRVRTIANYVPYKGLPLKERIFAGVHLLSPNIFNWLKGEGNFSTMGNSYPEAIVAGETFLAALHQGYFSDVGTIKRLWQTNMDVIGGQHFNHLQPLARFKNASAGEWRGERVKLNPGAKLFPPVLIDDEASIEEGAQIGPFAVIGKGVHVKPFASIAHTVVMSATEIKEREQLAYAVACEDLRVGVKKLT
jgi:NDP-sugar pyrophosphorylase family protein